MDDSFTPLFPQRKPGAFSPISGAAGLQPLHPAPPPASQHPAPSPAQHSCVKAATPLVTFRKDGDRVTQIHIECPCGQRIVLDCEY